MTDNSPQPKTDINHQAEPKFNWKNCWYPVAFLQDLERDRPYCFSLYDIPLVLFRNQSGEWGCLEDRCSHRAAKLSDGQLVDGKIECLYHGWQFSVQGDCLHIPQLPQGATIPQKACISTYQAAEHQGVVWVWPGESHLADRGKIITEANLDEDGMVCIDTVADLPFEQTYLVENFLDPAHVFISHDRTELGIKRENARPLEMEVLSVSARGFEGRYRSGGMANGNWAKVEFIAPHIVRYKFSNEALGSVFGFELYAIALTPHSSRVLVRRYGNFFPASFKLKPLWLEHLRQNKVLEEDLFFIVAQQEYVEKSGKAIKDVYLPLKTSDTFLIEHRKWLDKYGTGLPFYEGYATGKHLPPKGAFNAEAFGLDRLTRHTRLCHSCSGAYRTTERLKRASLALALVLAAGGIVTDGWQQFFAVSAALISVLLATLAGRLKAKFEQAYRRPAQ